MPILWSLDQIADERDQHAWLALVLDKQRQLLKARAIAEKAAFDDLPPNEQRTYLAYALDALKEMDKAS